MHVTNTAVAPSQDDPNSLATQARVMRTRHLHLDLDVDFVRSVLAGSVVLTMERVGDTTAAVPSSTLCLDTGAGMTVGNVEWREVASGADPFHAASTNVWKPVAKWTLDAESAPFGRALRVELPEAVATLAAFDLRVAYETSPSASAVQWLRAEQTVTKQHPYLFTQCQAIHARSMVPCQDTPAVKATYTAEVRVPAPLRALMSANRLGEGVAVVAGKTTAYRFRQDVPIPSYLIALAVGALQGIDIGPRTTVWSEAGMVEKGAWEFAETEKFIATAEDLLTPYCWGRYDLLLLPPSFPYGGMENPCLTFVTPTLLAGDRSLVDVVAHEISHSWAGNLVTNQNWQHFWLNEGWCVFIERKILGRLHGEDMRQFKSILGWKALRESVELFGADNPLTKLQPALEGIDPDDAFSSVPYEKGFAFLYHLESVLGGSAVFEPFMKAYYVHFHNQSLTTDSWKQFLYDYMRQHHSHNIAKLDAVDWEAWLNKPGMPPIAMPYDPKMVDVCSKLAKKWDGARAFDHATIRKDFPAGEFLALSSGQKIVFFEKLGELSKLPHVVIAAMEDVYALANVTNSEIRFRWQELCLKADYEPIFEQVVRFVTEQGRMKFVRPLYRSLYKAKNGEELARKTFVLNRSFYHPIAAQMIAKDLRV